MTETVQVAAITGGTITPLTDGASIAWLGNKGFCYSLTLGGNNTIENPSGLTIGTLLTLYMTQGAGGNHVPVWGTAFQFVNGVPPVPSTAEGAVDIYLFSTDGTNMTLLSLIKGVGNQLTAPSSLTATNDLTRQVDLAWTNNDSSATATIIEQESLIPGDWFTLATVSYPGNTYQDSDIEPGDYNYRVRASRGPIRSTPSNQVTGTATL